jgi:branched-subunit amino acid aminotransferase/4-amino-4-deoxychorismate lyase
LIADPSRRPARALDRWVWIDGEMRRGEDAVLSVFDRGARDGEGLLETLRVYGGEPFQWARHLERLVVSAAELGFPVPPSPRALREGLAELLERAALTDAAARITVTRGIPGGGGKRARTGAWIEVEPITARLWRAGRSGVRVVYSRPPFEPGPLGRHKTTSRLAYHLARDEARAARAHEALLVAPDGAVLEGSVSNLFVVDAGVVRTPPLSLGILPGITRATVLALCADSGVEAEESRLTSRDLERVDEIFMTNSLQEVVAVSELEGRSRAFSTTVAARLQLSYAALVAQEAERGARPPTVA